MLEVAAESLVALTAKDSEGTPKPRRFVPGADRQIAEQTFSLKTIHPERRSYSYRRCSVIPWPVQGALVTGPHNTNHRFFESLLTAAKARSTWSK